MKLYLDEDLSTHQLVGALRSHGLDVLTSFEAGMSGHGDDSQLAYAADQGRLLITANTRDFAQLHGEWLRQGRSHSGIVLVPQHH